MEDEGVADVYMPMQLDQQDGGSPPVEATGTKDAPTNGTLPPFEGENLEKLVPSLVHEGVRKSAGYVEMAVPAEDDEAAASGKGGSGRRKRGRKAARDPVKAKKSEEEEDICFICFDGGNLVLCDRRFCPKAYHPTCVHRDEAFFKKKGRWYCGWHLCSICAKAAHFLCCTCTYSLCKGCIKKSDFLYVRSNKGLCVNCMILVKLIENKDARKEDVVVDFDDKANWEYLFKEYWLDVKRKLSLTPAEVANANNPWKGSGAPIASANELYNAKNGQNNISAKSPRCLEKSKSSLERQKKKRRTDGGNEVPSRLMPDTSREGPSRLTDSDQWASKELLDFVEHMQGGRASLSAFEVQSLLMDYVTKYKLRDPNKKSQIICDARLHNLFGKDRVGHFEMLKLTESHILIKETPPQVPEIQRENEDAEITKLDLDDSPLARMGTDKKHKSKKRADESTPKANLTDYAAVDVHNINLIYLRRNLVENLLDDPDKFREKIIGSFVRIRIAGSGKKQDMYRLVKVVGTSQAAKDYKTGKKSTDVMLEILNLNKTEAITIDSISNQEFSEEECKRLCQSIKYGFIGPLTVAEVQEKAKILQHVKVNDWFETEILRLSHLRDRASEKGRQKELRECLEKFQVLSDPDGRVRKLQDLPEVHVDSHMDPDYESDEKEDDEKRENHMQPRDPRYSKRGWETTSPKPIGDGWDSSRKISRGSWERNKNSSVQGEPRTERNQQSVHSVWNQSKGSYAHHGGHDNDTANKTWNQASEKPSGTLPEISLMLQSVDVTMPAGIGETEKMWLYCDPTGKVQGPFSMVQLRKWSATGYFPADLRIWRTSERQGDSVLLNYALAGKFRREHAQSDLQGSCASHKGAVAGNQDNDLRTRSGDTTAWTSGTQSNRNWNSSFKTASGGGVETTRRDGWETKSTGSLSSSMGALEPKQRTAASDRSGGPESWSSQRLVHDSPLTCVDNSYKTPLEQNKETQARIASARWVQPESTTGISDASTSSSVVQPGGTWTATQGSGKHMGNASSTQVLGDVLQVRGENSSSKERMESTSLANPIPAAERDGVAISGGSDRSDLPTPMPKSAGVEWSEDGASESQISALQFSDEPMSPLNNLEQQSSACTAKSAGREWLKDGASESKTSPAHVSDETMKTLGKQCPLNTSQLKDEASQSKTSSPEISVQPLSPANNFGHQTSESKTSGPQVSAEQLSPADNLERQSSVAEAQITPAAADEQRSTSGVTSVTEQESALATPDLIPFVGVCSNGQYSGTNSSGSSPEPAVGVVCDANKNHEVDLSAEPVSSVGSGASSQCQLPSVSVEDTLDDEVHNDSRDSGVCNVISVKGHDSAEKLWADGTAVESFKQEVDSHDDVICSVADLADVAAKDAQKSSAGLMLESVETKNALLANDYPATCLFNPINDLAAHLIPVDDIWDALGPDGAQSGCDFSPDEVISMEKVHDSDAISLEEDDIMWPEGHRPVSVTSPIPADGRVSDPGSGGNASGSGSQSAATAFSPTLGSEMIPQPVVSIPTIQGEGPFIVPEAPEVLQKPADLPPSQLTISADGGIGHECRAGEEAEFFVKAVPVAQASQSVNHLVMSHPSPACDQDVSATTATSGASGVLSLSSSNSVQGIHDASRAGGSSPLLVPSEEQCPTTSPWGTVPSIGQNAHSNTVTKESSVSVIASHRNIPMVRNPQTANNFIRDFSTSATVASQKAPSSDSWYTSSKPNSGKSFGFPPPAATGNVSSGATNPYLHENGKMPTTSEGWGGAENSPATSTGQQGLPSSDDTWRYNGGNEPSRSRSDLAQSTESSRMGWNPQPGNVNARWGVHSGNQKGGWEQQRRDRDRHPSYGDRGGYGAQGHGGRSWNRSAAASGCLGGSSTGSGGGPRTPRAQKVCKFYESGYCKKGAACDFLHP